MTYVPTLYLSHTRTQCTLAFALLGWLALGQRAAAEPSAAARETARSLMDEGDRLRDEGDLWSALERFVAADQIMHVPTTGLELARMQAALSLLVEARGSALNAANRPASAAEAGIFVEARADANQLAAELGPRIPDVVVLVEPASADPHVQIDGDPLPQLRRPLPFKLNPGEHRLEVSAPGFAARTLQFSLVEAQHAELRIPLTPDAASPLPAAARASLADDGTAGRTRAYVGLVAGGVLLATGIATGILSAVRTNELSDTCDDYRCPASARSRLDTANTLANVANVTVPLGLLGIGYGLFELFTHAKPEAGQPQRTRLDVSLGARQASVELRGAL